MVRKKEQERFLISEGLQGHAEDLEDWEMNKWEEQEDYVVDTMNFLLGESDEGGDSDGEGNKD